MSPAQKNQSSKSEQVVYEPCPCRELLEAARKLLGISPEVKQHLANSRVEFLKAIRQVIDDRIEHLSAQGQKGTKVAVE
jgi:hypothetical protein